MATYTKVGKGFAFPKDKKGERSPDFSGSIELLEDLEEGKYSIAMWKTKSKAGSKYLSMQISSVTKDPEKDTSGPWDNK
jgi:hypothetical protein|tara:strand:- start:1502 stop:1738 length:237 start_codon:yes stop_codon:yes gene_type:complete